MTADRDTSLQPQMSSATMLESTPGIFRQLLESAPDAVVIVDDQGHIILVNKLAETTFGYGRSELLGQPVEALIPERFRSPHISQRSRYLQDPRTRRMGEGSALYCLRKDGTEFPAEISLSPIETPSGLVVTTVIRDITYRLEIEDTLKAQAEELQRSNAELEQFAYVASHDLQEPLRMVASYAQLLARRYQGKLEGDADDFIHFIVDGAVRMQDLINDLLDYSRVGTRGKEFVETDCNAILDQVRHNLAITIEETQASIDYADLPTVLADANQLLQLLQNLVANAIKFRGDVPPRVQITAENLTDAYLFRVSDNGIGIQPQFYERIFLLFQRLHSKREYPGTGIGLAICKKIVERHGGRIWVESVPGQGTTFSFTLAKSL